MLLSAPHRGGQLGVISTYRKISLQSKGSRDQLCSTARFAAMRGSAKKDELLKFPTSSLFCDLYWKVILHWTSWTVLHS